MPSSVPIFRPPHEVTIQRCALAHPHHVHAPSTIFPCFVVIASQLCRLFSFNRSKIENIPNRGAAFDSLPSTWKLLRVSCPSRFDPDAFTILLIIGHFIAHFDRGFISFSSLLISIHRDEDNTFVCLEIDLDFSP